MRLPLKLSLLLTTLILSSCGPHAPIVDDCAIAPSLMKCYRQRVQKNQPHAYSLTPAQADKYVCQLTSDFLNSRIYILNLENHLAKCDKTPVVKPTVSDCGVDGAIAEVFCSNGVGGNWLTWEQAEGMVCFSLSDFELGKAYVNTLIQDIGSCQ